MSTTISRTDVLEGVSTAISDCLAIDREDITQESTFFNDLDGESIDVIDLMFRCEKRFGVRVELQSLLSDIQLDMNGRITEESIRILQSKAPEIDWSSRVAAITSSDPRDILTVDLICELITAAHSHNRPS